MTSLGIHDIPITDEVLETSTWKQESQMHEWQWHRFLFHLDEQVINDEHQYLISSVNTQ